MLPPTDYGLLVAGHARRGRGSDGRRGLVLGPGSPGARSRAVLRTSLKPARNPSGSAVRPRGSSGSAAPGALGSVRYPARFGQLEVGLFAELALQPLAQLAVAPPGLGAPTALDVQHDQFALHVGVERLGVGEAAQGNGRSIEVVLSLLDVADHAQRALGAVPQAVALGQRPFRVGLVGQELAAVQLQPVLQAAEDPRVGRRWPARARPLRRDARTRRRRCAPCGGRSRTRRAARGRTKRRRGRAPARAGCAGRERVAHDTPAPQSRGRARATRRSPPRT